MPALAKSYTMGPVVIEAQVKPDGSMSVVEQRSFDFTGDYSRVYWDLATGTARRAVTVNAVEEIVGGQAQPAHPDRLRRRRPTGRPAPTTSSPRAR